MPTCLFVSFQSTWNIEVKVFIFSFVLMKQSGLEMATDTVANVTKMVRLATRSFQAVDQLAT